MDDPSRPEIKGRTDVGASGGAVAELRPALDVPAERRPSRPSGRDGRCSRHTRPARRVSIRAVVGALGAPG